MWNKKNKTIRLQPRFDDLNSLELGNERRIAILDGKVVGITEECCQAHDEANEVLSSLDEQNT